MNLEDSAKTLGKVKGRKCGAVRGSARGWWDSQNHNLQGENSNQFNLNAGSFTENIKELEGHILYFTHATNTELVYKLLE